MKKDVTSCPHCGKSFSSVGVIEMQCYRHGAEGGKVVLGEGSLDETVLVCGGCEHVLEFRDVGFSWEVQVIG